MNIFRSAMSIFLFMVFYSCSNENHSNDEIDKFISKYQNEHFDSLKGISVFQRSRTVDEIVYGIGKYEGNRPLYFIEYNIPRKSISKINKSLLEKDSIQDYLTKSEITNAVNTIRKYDFFLLAVDSSENVFVNPFYINAPAYFLRIKTETGDSIVRKGYVYKLYKGNWYINKTLKK